MCIDFSRDQRWLSVEGLRKSPVLVQTSWPNISRTTYSILKKWVCTWSWEKSLQNDATHSQYQKYHVDRRWLGLTLKLSKLRVIGGASVGIVWAALSLVAAAPCGSCACLPFWLFSPFFCKSRSLATSIGYSRALSLCTLYVNPGSSRHGSFFQRKKFCSRLFHFVRWSKFSFFFLFFFICVIYFASFYSIRGFSTLFHSISVCPGSIVYRSSCLFFCGRGDRVRQEQFGDFSNKVRGSYRTMDRPTSPGNQLHIRHPPCFTMFFILSSFLRC